MVTLFHCQFCGSNKVNNTAYESGRDIDGKVTDVIVCPDCGCSIRPPISLREAATIWNMRPDIMEGAMDDKQYYIGGKCTHPNNKCGECYCGCPLRKTCRVRDNNA